MDRKIVLLAKAGADDDEIIIKLLNSYGYEVIHLKDGISVLNTVKKQHPSIAVIDSSLPEIDGFTVCKKLKDDFLTSYIPVIMLINKKSVRKRLLEIERGIDDYIVKPPDPIDLQVRIEIALRRAEHKFFNPLTKLPGSIAIEQEIEGRIRENKIFSVAYGDINNFKAFNDRYGYAKGNLVIQQTANIIATSVRNFGGPGDFVGHIGGDDFLFVTTPEKENIISYQIITEFERLMKLHYAKEDREKGFVSVKDRSGNKREVPLISFSISIVNNRNKKFDNYLEIGQIASEIKNYLKTLKKSAYLVNRREGSKGEPHNRKEEKAFKENGYILKEKDLKEKLPLGEILLQANKLSESDLNLALRRHLITGQKFGEILIDMGFATPKDIGLVLAEQKDIPIAEIDAETFEIDEDFPLDVIREFKVIPLQRDGKKMKIAMVNPFDEQIIESIKDRLKIKPEVSYIDEETFNRVVSKVTIPE